MLFRSKHLRDFHEKRNSEVLKMADELGSTAIARLLADEVQSVVDRKTANLQQIISDQKSQLDEVIDLLSEKENDCQHRVEMAEAKATQANNDATEKVSKAMLRVENAESEIKNAQQAAELAQKNATETIANTENKCDLLITNAKSEAVALVDAANRRADKAELESASLREQVTLLSVEQAKREIEQAQHEKTLEQHNQVMGDLAQERTRVVQLQTQQDNQIVEVKRLSSELGEVKVDSRLLASAQGQLVELHKQISQLQSELSLSDRERESLSIALRSQK